MAYADVFAAATAIAYEATLWTGDPELLVVDALCGSGGISVAQPLSYRPSDLPMISFMISVVPP